MSERLSSDRNLAGLRVVLTIHRATGLVAKDRNKIGKRTSSDPYVKVFYGNTPVGKTPVKEKTLNPEWNHRVSHLLGINDAEKIRRALPTARNAPSMLLVLYDADKVTTDDPLGQVIVPVAMDGMVQQVFKITTGDLRSGFYCKKAKGEIIISIEVSSLILPSIVRGNVLPLKMKDTGTNSLLKVGLGWEVTQHETPIDLDVSCVAVGTNGKVLMKESVYFANLKNPNGSIVHSGDERKGLKSIGKDGSDDREQIMIDLNRLPERVAAYVLLVTVATPGVDFSKITSARFRICDGTTGIGFCAFRLAFEGEATAMFCMRIGRKRNVNGQFSKGLYLATIGETDVSARDFGSLIPEIKGFCRDLLPEMEIDPNERIAIMNKEVTIRVKDYAPERNTLPSALTMGLAWDITNGVNIDLDASAVCLDASFNLVELVNYKNLHSDDGAIHHSGDEREGDELGDDEKITVSLNAVNPKVEHIVFVINSYSGQELDDIAMAKCHLFDPVQCVDLCTYTLTNNSALDKHTACLLANLYRDASSRDWMMRILSVPSQGKIASHCVSHIGDYLKRVPPHEAATPPNPDVVMTEMPVVVPVEQEISFVPLDEEIVMDTPVVATASPVVVMATPVAK